MPSSALDKVKSCILGGGEIINELFKVFLITDYVENCGKLKVNIMGVTSLYSFLNDRSSEKLW